MPSDLKRIIEQISRDKGIEKHLLVETIEEAVRSAARKKFGNRRDMEVQFNDELGEVEIFQFRMVVETVMWNGAGHCQCSPGILFAIVGFVLDRVARRFA